MPLPWFAIMAASAAAKSIAGGISQNQRLRKLKGQTNLMARRARSRMIGELQSGQRRLTAQRRRTEAVSLSGLDPRDPSRGLIAAKIGTGYSEAEASLKAPVYRSIGEIEAQRVGTQANISAERAAIPGQVWGELAGVGSQYALGKYQASQQTQQQQNLFAQQQETARQKQLLDIYTARPVQTKSGQFLQQTPFMSQDTGEITGVGYKPLSGAAPGTSYFPQPQGAVVAPERKIELKTDDFGRRFDYTRDPQTQQITGNLVVPGHYVDKGGQHYKVTGTLSEPQYEKISGEGALEIAKMAKIADVQEKDADLSSTKGLLDESFFEATVGIERFIGDREKPTSIGSDPMKVKKGIEDTAKIVGDTNPYYTYESALARLKYLFDIIETETGGYTFGRNPKPPPLLPVSEEKNPIKRGRDKATNDSVDDPWDLNG